MVFFAIGVVIAAYLLGSINFAVIFSNAFLKKDVRKMGSGNAGTTNVMRNAGFLPGALTFLGDALKGFVATFGGKLAFEYIYNTVESEWAAPIYGAYICGLACMLGHVFPLFFQFKGGKGVATSVGIYGVCCPLAIVFGIVVFAVGACVSKIVSLSSIIATVVVVSSSIIFYDSRFNILVPAIISIIMGVIVITKHKDNIKRLINGTESKIGGKKSNG